MTDAQRPYIWSGQSDPFGILALFRSDVAPSMSGQSDQPAVAVPAGPTGPTDSDRRWTEKTTQKQCGPTGPTKIDQQFVAGAPADSHTLHLLDHYEERAAIREYDGGQLRAEAEAGALAEAASLVGLTSNMLRKLWAAHPDAQAYLAYLSATGPTAYVDAASTLHWDPTRAWQAEARLRASGLLTLDSRGRAHVRKEEDLT